jgi:parallel beta-helix repeat protein
VRAIVGRIAVVAALICSVFAITAPTAHAGPVSCGQTIVANTTLTSDVGPCAPCQGGVVIGADNVTFDLNGHTIFGLPGTGEGPGVLVPGRIKVTIRNGTVRNFDAGVVIRGGSSNTVTNMAIRNNIGVPSPCSPFTDGIAVVTSSNNRILFNTVINNWIDGISMSLGASGNLVYRNRVASNGFGGPTAGDGIRVFGRNNLILSNMSVDNARDGISVGRRSPATGPLPLLNGRNNLIVSNFANPNVAFDHWDSNAFCDANTWSNPPAGVAFRPLFIAPPCAT